MTQAKDQLFISYSKTITKKQKKNPNKISIKTAPNYSCCIILLQTGDVHLLFMIRLYKFIRKKKNLTGYEHLNQKYFLGELFLLKLHNCTKDYQNATEE